MATGIRTSVAHLAIVTAAFGATAAAAAQTADTSPPVAATAPAGSAPVESAPVPAPAEPPAGEIVVTAQRRSEQIQNVPISINVASGDALRAAGVTRLEDISRIAPAVQVSRTGVYTQPAVRGITTLQSATVENNVAVYIDGFYQVSPRSLNLDLMNVASVEVLKGPQGTLFGRNATGGALLVNTLQPSLSGVEARASVGYASFNDKRAQGYISVPLGDKIAFNLSGSYRNSDGYIRNVSGGFRDTAPLGLYNVDGKLRLKLNDRLNITLGFRWNEVSDGRGLAITIDDHALASLLAPTVPIEKGDNRTSLNHPVINRSNLYSATSKIEYDAGPVTLTSLTLYQRENDYSHFEADGSPAPVYDQYYRETFRTVTQEANLRSNGGGRLQYVAGVYYFDSTSQQPYNYSRFAPAATYTRQQNPIQNTRSIAAYADVTWQLVDNLFLTGGIRYSHEKRTLDLLSGTLAPLFDNTLKFNKVTPRAVIRYQLAPNQSIYASFSQGYKSGFINVTAPYTVVNPEKINAYEIGYKRANRGFSFSTAAYYYDYRNLQVSSIVLFNNSQSTVTANAANARIYGAEASLTVPVTRDFVTSANLAYTHARYRSFPNAVVSLPNALGLNSSSCANPSPPPATAFCTQNWSGLQIARAPDWSGNVSASYTLHAGAHRIAFSGNVAFTSSYLPTKSDIGLNGAGYRYQQGGYALLALQAAWTLPGDRLTLTVFGNNVTDHRYYIVKTGSAFGDYHVLGEPATVGVRADYHF